MTTGSEGQYSTESAAIFNEETADDGGRLDTTTLHPNTAETMKYVAHRARGFVQNAAAALPELPPIHFDLIDNLQFNAVAFPSEGRYFIGIHRGAVSSLAVLFDRMLADPEVLPFIGDPREETADLPLLPDIGLDFEKSFATVPAFPGPQNPARQATARRLWELALDFLTVHEITHIANGHVDYLRNYQGISAIEEADKSAWASSSSEYKLTRQTMEMDADAMAVHISLSSEWGRVTGKYPRPGPEWDDIYSRPGMVSLQWSWAVSTLFRLMGDARLVGGDVTQEIYPRPRLRTVMAQQAAGQAPRPEELQEHSTLVGEDFYNIPPAIKAASLDVESIFARLTGRPASSEGLDDAWGEVGRSQIRRLQEHWQTKLRDELLEFAYQLLLPHQMANGEDGSQAG